MRHLLSIVSLLAFVVCSDIQINNDSTSALYLDINEFTYANHRLYTFSGKTPYKNSEISTKKIIKSSIILVGTQYFLVKYTLGDSWWETGGQFHFEQNENYSNSIDKVGHAYVGYVLSKLNTDIFLSRGASWEQATLYGGIVSFAQTFLTEYEDGFAMTYGFSKYDIYSNCIGILFHYLQYYVPFFQNFTPKYAYTYNRIISDTKKYNGALIDNYEQIKLFMSINVKNMLPSKYNGMWIKGLDLVIGYGVKGFDKIDSHYLPHYLQKQYYYYGINLNLLPLLSNNGSRWNWLGQTINHIKFPSPMIEVK